ncbi:hypothetical protein EVAR_76711_1 [Eumeta japonica]|uniref:Uncharacterized protein n=1 Tax=Eumeta variegata TaxID=151549 RepID=A0A4C1SVJ5_EUMVA|nr:hypothetical protein EVAR_76711_1 [Eumeta japonica]
MERNGEPRRFITAHLYANYFPPLAVPAQTENRFDYDYNFDHDSGRYAVLGSNPGTDLMSICLALDSGLSPVINFDTFRFRLPILLYVPFAISFVLPVTAPS